MALSRLAPLLVLVGGLILVFALGLERYLTFDALRENRDALLGMVADNQITTALGFMGIYIAAVALSVPGAAILTLTAGFLFGPWLGGSLAVIAATIGACLLFLAARYAVGDVLRARFGPRLQAFEAGFQQDAWSYLLVLRLVPLFPFFLVNLAPALLGVRFHVFAITTLLGILPGTFVFAGVGHGLGAVFDAGAAPSLQVIFEPAVLFPLLGLAGLSLIPILYRRFKAKP